MSRARYFDEFRPVHPVVRRRAEARVVARPLESQGAEAFFKALLWVMLVLMTVVFVRQFNREMRKAARHAAETRAAQVARTAQV